MIFVFYIENVRLHLRNDHTPLAKYRFWIRLLRVPFAREPT